MDTAFTAATSDVNVALTKIGTAQGEVDGLTGKLNGPDGLVAGMNCVFVRGLLLGFEESFCKGFIQVNFVLLILQIIIGLAMFFKLINEYRIERKLDIIGKHEKV